jgi:hypothetical protein
MARFGLSRLFSFTAALSWSLVVSRSSLLHCTVELLAELELVPLNPIRLTLKDSDGIYAHRCRLGPRRRRLVDA